MHVQNSQAKPNSQDLILTNTLKQQPILFQAQDIKIMAYKQITIQKDYFYKRLVYVLLESTVLKWKRCRRNQVISSQQKNYDQLWIRNALESSMKEKIQNHLHGSSNKQSLSNYINISNSNKHSQHQNHQVLRCDHQKIIKIMKRNIQELELKNIQYLKQLKKMTILNEKSIQSIKKSKLKNENLVQIIIQLNSSYKSKYKHQHHENEHENEIERDSTKIILENKDPRTKQQNNSYKDRYVQTTNKIYPHNKSYSSKSIQCEQFDQKIKNRKEESMKNNGNSKKYQIYSNIYQQIIQIKVKQEAINLQIQKVKILKEKLYEDERNNIKILNEMKEKNKMIEELKKQIKILQSLNQNYQRINTNYKHEIELQKHKKSINTNQLNDLSSKYQNIFIQYDKLKQQHIKLTEDYSNIKSIIDDLQFYEGKCHKNQLSLQQYCSPHKIKLFNGINSEETQTNNSVQNDNQGNLQKPLDFMMLSEDDEKVEQFRVLLCPSLQNNILQNNIKSTSVQNSIHNNNSLINIKQNGNRDLEQNDTERNGQQYIKKQMISRYFVELFHPSIKKSKQITLIDTISSILNINPSQTKSIDQYKLKITNQEIYQSITRYQEKGNHQKRYLIPEDKIEDKIFRFLTNQSEEEEETTLHTSIK